MTQSGPQNSSGNRPGTVSTGSQGTCSAPDADSSKISHHQPPGSGSRKPPAVCKGLGPLVFPRNNSQLLSAQGAQRATWHLAASGFSHSLKPTTVLICIDAPQHPSSPGCIFIKPGPSALMTHMSPHHEASTRILPECLGQRHLENKYSGKAGELGAMQCC